MKELLTIPKMIVVFFILIVVLTLPAIFLGLSLGIAATVATETFCYLDSIKNLC